MDKSSFIAIMNSDRFESDGNKLTPNVFAKALVHLYDGKRFRRMDAIEKVMKYHANNGGIIEDKDYAAVFKSATKKPLKGFIDQKGYGEWYLHYEESLDRGSDEEKLADTDGDETFYDVDLTIGEGRQAVYLYYMDSDATLAEINKEKYWPCKIGMTTVSVGQRIKDLSQTGLPRKPHVALVIRADDARLVESILHSVLIYNRRQVDEATGMEWYMTNPCEVQDIYERLRLEASEEVDV